MQTLRDYQERAVDGVFQAWKDSSSTLLVMATGLGKTTVFTEIIRRQLPSRAIILAHRSELVHQAEKRCLEFGIDTAIEMGDFRAEEDFWAQKPVIVGTVQTQCAGNRGQGRMAIFDPHEFGLLVIDEGHHSTSPSYRRVVDYYKQNPNLKILAVTATPDRADKEALGQVFESVAFEYGILDGINDGWLTLVDQKTIYIEGLDFSHIRTQAGDLHNAELSAVMEGEKPLHGVATATFETIGERKAVIFCVSVKQAESLAEILNRHKPGMAGFVCGETPADERKQLLRDFEAGRTQVITNCGVLTEGWDSPSCEVIVMARPTKSRSLYTQMVGRALRPLPGIVDGIDMPKERRRAIADSPKPAMLVLDFAGNAGRHKLISTVDILGGKVSEEARARATEKIKKADKATRLNEVLKEADREIKAEIEARKAAEAERRRHIKAKAQYRMRNIDAFDRYDREPSRDAYNGSGYSLTEKQRAFLIKHGYNPDAVSPGAAKRLLGDLLSSFKNNGATEKQCQILSRYQYDPTGMSKKEASKIIDSIAANGWKRPEAAA